MSLPEKFVQLEMFPIPRDIEALDPRVAIGPETRVKALYRVRYGETRLVHQVYRDRHGWYCAEHGPGCPAVSDAVNAARSRVRRRTGKGERVTDANEVDHVEA